MAEGTVLTIGTTGTVIAGSGTHGVIHVTVRNRGGASIYLGGSDVTTAGYPLSTADDPIQVRVMAGETLYGASTGSISVQVLRMNETT